jgi:lipoprotein-anchoring transpeptidase ErfK/SrfK
MKAASVFLVPHRGLKYRAILRDRDVCCLECAVIVRHLPYPMIRGCTKRGTMDKRILTLMATVAAIATTTSLAYAQSYPVSREGYVTQGPGNRGSSLPDFDDVDDDQGPAPSRLSPPGAVMAPDAPGYARSAAPPVYSDRGPAPQGPVMSPDDPRYGRPLNAPVYSDRSPAPQGPVMSPDDPRYGRPMNAPIYSDRAPVPQGPVTSPDDPRYGRAAEPPAMVYSDRDDGSMRPPAAVGAAASTGAPPPVIGATGSVGPAAQSSDRPIALASLPPEEQPEADQGFQLPAHLRRQEVEFKTKEPAGTIVVDTPNTQLYYVLGGGRAVRYGVRVGRDGFTWTGVQKISRKAEWPDWHPPTEMIERQPYLPRFMAGGPGNPLGARAMYLGSTVFRIHGTNQPSTIGKFVSSGCIGMLNDDVSDLFDRVKVGTRVVVLPGGPPPAATANAARAPLLPATASAQPPAVSSAAQAAPLPGAQPSSVPPLPAPVTIR